MCKVSGCTDFLKTACTFGLLWEKSAEFTSLVPCNYLLIVVLYDRFMALYFAEYWTYACQIFVFQRETLYRLCFEVSGTGPLRKKMKKKNVSSYGNAWLLLTFKVRGWLGHIFTTSASPRTSMKKPATYMSPASTAHGRQLNTCVPFEKMLLPAFVGERISVV